MVDDASVSLDFDPRRLALAALVALSVYAIFVEMRQRRQQNQHLKEIRRILNPYYDIQQRRWKDPSGVDPSSSNIEVGVAQNLDDEDDTDDGEEASTVDADFATAEDIPDTIIEDAADDWGVEYNAVVAELWGSPENEANTDEAAAAQYARELYDEEDEE